jgi:hypothetical protein
MLAINHPSLGDTLGMSPGQSGANYSFMRPSPIIRSVQPVPTPPSPPPVHVAPAPAPVPSEIQISPPQVLSHITAPIYTVDNSPTSSPAVPASAAAGTSPTSAAAPPSDSFSSFLTWLEDQTVFPGYPNGLVFAGGVIGALWLFGGSKKGRR